MKPDTDGRLLLGVDGGGSACRARLADGAGRTLGEGVSGPANVSYDAAGSWRSISEAVAMAFGQAGIDGAARRNTAMCLGLAGLDPYHPEVPAGWPLDEFLCCTVETDAMIALRGAHDGGDGAVLIVGTGSVGLAVSGAERVSVGGYGTILSDEGSGSWLGREAIRRMLWSFDGRLPDTPMTRALREVLGGPREAVGWARVATAADFARFAPLVLDAASKGDETADGLIHAGARLLERIVERLARTGADGVALLGGLAPSLMPWLDFGDLPIRPVKGDALSGAIGIAARMAKAVH